MKRNLFLSLGNIALKSNRYYNDGDAAAEEEAKKAAEEAAKKAAADELARKAAAEKDPFRKLGFTQEQQEFTNRLLAEERRAMQQQNAKTIEELKKVQQLSTTSEQQKKELQSRIEELQRQHMSKEEIAKQEQERAAKEWQQQLTQQKSRGDHWEKLYQESTIKRALLDEAGAQDAWRPQQLVNLLYTITRLVPEVDADNKETGNLIPRVHLPDVDKDGKPVTLDLTVREAMQKMKNTPEEYGNLFKSTLAGGLGQNGSANGGGKKGKAAKDMTPEEWAEARKKDPNLHFANRS